MLKPWCLYLKGPGITKPSPATKFKEKAKLYKDRFSVRDDCLHNTYYVRSFTMWLLFLPCHPQAVTAWPLCPSSPVPVLLCLPLALPWTVNSTLSTVTGNPESTYSCSCRALVHQRLNQSSVSQVSLLLTEENTCSCGPGTGLSPF